MKIKELKKGEKFRIGKSKKIKEFIWSYLMNDIQMCIYWDNKGQKITTRNVDLEVNKISNPA